MKALVVDDNVLVREVVAGFVKAMGCEAYTVESGEKALDMLATESFDVVVTDGRMAGMSGPELTAIIKRKYPQVLVVGISGNDLEKPFKAAGADAFLLKPVKFENIRKAISKSNS